MHETIGLIFDLLPPLREWGKFYKKKSYPQISDVNNIIQKFYPKFFIQNVLDLFYTSLYINFCNL